MIFAFEEALRLARTDEELLPHLLAATRACSPRSKGRHPEMCSKRSSAAQSRIKCGASDTCRYSSNGGRVLPRPPRSRNYWSRHPAPPRS